MSFDADNTCVPSTSFASCFDSNGYPIIDRYIAYQREGETKQIYNNDNDEKDYATILQLVAPVSEADCLLEDMNENVDSKKKKRIRSCYKIELHKKRHSNGDIVDVTPQESSWWYLYVVPSSDTLSSQKFICRFRRRFRMQYESYLVLLDKIKKHDMFRTRWMSNDAFGRKSAPIELLLLGALRYLGRGWTFDDIEESTCISEENNRQFLHKFILWGSTDFYNEQVKVPENSDDLKQHTAEFAMAGFHGCAGSVDATHVSMLRCNHTRANEHRGPKMDLPSRTYNLTCNHRRKILCSTTGHPARWNDKTLTTFDPFLNILKKGKNFKENIFILLQKNKYGDVIEKEYCGCWLLCDNGYLPWSVLVPPFKGTETSKTPDLRWSQMLESMRKDVECTFGILKTRFRILKTGIRLHGIGPVDKVWLTCCALHNFLLQEDGLDKYWGTHSELGYHDTSDMHRYNSLNNNTLPFALRRLNDPTLFRNLDLSGMGEGNDRNDDCDHLDDDNTIIKINEAALGNHIEGDVIDITKLSREFFRSLLVQHFDILHDRNEIKWPSRRM